LFVILIFILVVQGNLQGIPIPKENEKKKKHFFKVVKSFEDTKKFGKPWYVKEKVGRSAKVLKEKNMGTTS
jgi:hypothetical protein